MRKFSANDYLMLLERGSGLHAIDRALLILAHALRELGEGELAQVPLGQRDRLLFEVRKENFGDRLDALDGCAACGERVEFSLSCSALLADTESAQTATLRITLDGAVFELRCPNSVDLGAVAGSVNVDAGEQLLLARCVVHDGAAEVLTPARRAALAAAFAALDPAAEILLDLMCPACAHSWQALFDINQVLWLEIRARAHRLLQEVDALARSYHWSESEILAMSPSRRALYLEMALS